MKIPFIKNRISNSECLQASLIMVLRFYGIKKVTFKDINTYTHFKKKGYSFFASSINYLLSKGLHVVLIESFNYKKFAKEGKKYMKLIIDDDVFEEFDSNIDLDFESFMMKKNLNKNNFVFKKRKATIKDIEFYVNKGIPVITSINPNRLIGNKKYGSHAVVVYNITKKIVSFHDPGLPAIKNATVSRSLFKKAFTDGDPRTSNIIAIQN